MRTVALSAAVLAVLAAAAPRVSAEGCKADATVKEVVQAKPASGVTGGIGGKAAHEIRFDVAVRGCPDSPGRPSKFARPSYGTITYHYKKRFLRSKTSRVAPPDEEATGSQNWNKVDRELSATASVDVDLNSFFEVVGVGIDKVVCGCR